jgi:phospholipase C
MFLWNIVNAVIHSPQWPHLALLITFDENGGIYDHVPPPPACIPDDLPPQLPVGAPPAAFDRYGFRVPLIAVSPYARPHYVSHHVFDHTSLTRFVEARYTIGALTARDANAEPVFDLFDFTSPQMLDVAPLPAPSVNTADLDYCRLTFP